MNIYYDVEDNHYRTYPDGDIATIDQMRELIENKNLSIAKLQQENKQLKDNWNKLKKQEIDRFNESQDVQFLDVLQDMQELEQGSDSNERRFNNNGC